VGVVGVVFAGGGDAGGAFGEVFSVVEVAGVGGKLVLSVKC
jgi:hypothetical protein